MTVPPTEDGIHSLLGQILARQGEMQVQLAVVLEQLKSIPDHEARIRRLEQEAQQTTGSRDTWSRVIAGCALLAAVGSAIAQYLHP